MRSTPRPPASGSLTDPVLNALLEELVDKLHAGEAVDLDAYRLRYPEQAEKLDKVLPAMVAMAGLGWSVNPPGSPARRRDRSGQRLGGTHSGLGRLPPGP